MDRLERLLSAIGSHPVKALMRARAEHAKRRKEPLDTTVGASFSPDGRRILTTSADGTVRTYACDLCGGTQELLRIARAPLAALAENLSQEESGRYLRG
jgi:hypothetical protein